MTTPVETDTTSDTSTQRQASGRAPLVAAAILAVAALATAGITVGHHANAPVAAAATLPAAGTGPALGFAYDSACGLSGGTSDIPSSAPATDWQVINGWYLPVSTAHGPGRRSTNGPWTCFARTPYGAVLAAWTIPDRLALARDYAEVLRQQVLPGTGQANLLRAGRDHAQMIPAEPLGFRIDDYSNDAATIAFHTRQNNADMSCSARVQWQAGAQNDWVLVPQPNGDALSSCAPLPAATPPFVDWRTGH